MKTKRDNAESEAFKTQALKSLNKYEEAFLKYSKENPAGKIKVERKSLNLLLIRLEDKGVFRLEARHDLGLMEFQSPTMGLNSFKYCPQNNYWKSMTPESILDGMLVREFIKNCQGMLEL